MKDLTLFDIEKRISKIEDELLGYQMSDDLARADAKVSQLESDLRFWKDKQEQFPHRGSVKVVILEVGTVVFNFNKSEVQNGVVYLEESDIKSHVFPLSHVVYMSTLESSNKTRKEQQE